MKTSPILKATQLTKKFLFPSSLEVLKGIDLEVFAGESVAIVGKSGEGKSTLLHILGTLEKACSGTLEICGKNTSQVSLPELRNAHIGFIFQNCNLLDAYTTLDNILMPAHIARNATHSGSKAYKRALTLLETVGLKDRALYPCKLLSGGEKQRAALARALCNDPPLILADEPSGNLDNIHSQEIHALLIHLCKEFQKALIVVTHDQELSSLCDKRLVLKNGSLSTMADNIPLNKVCR
jgi:lipoprotein-releasing system ATP-binding protein